MNSPLIVHFLLFFQFAYVSACRTSSGSDSKVVGGRAVNEETEPKINGKSHCCFESA